MRNPSVIPVSSVIPAASVIPAKAGTHPSSHHNTWIPAFARMTRIGDDKEGADDKRRGDDERDDAKSGTPGRRAVFLDRDGVLNRAIVLGGRPFPPQDPAAFEILPGVPAACRRLREAGFCLLVVTNQPDVARGTQTRSAVERMHARLLQMIALDGVYVCYHQDRDGCDCRKPKPGLLRQAAQAWAIDLVSSFMVGDRSKDIEAGRRAGCRTILITGAHREPVAARPDYRAGSLIDALPFLLARSPAECAP